MIIVLRLGAASAVSMIEAVFFELLCVGLLFILLHIEIEAIMMAHLDLKCADVGVNSDLIRWILGVSFIKHVFHRLLLLLFFTFAHDLHIPLFLLIR